LNKVQNAVGEWLAEAKKLKETQDVWVAKKILEQLLASVRNSGFELTKIPRERQDFAWNEKMNQVNDDDRGQSTGVKQEQLHLFNFECLLQQLTPVRKAVERAVDELLRKGNCDIEDIITKLKDVKSFIVSCCSAHPSLSH
jgi:hypothetical protein